MQAYLTCLPWRSTPPRLFESTLLLHLRQLPAQRHHLFVAGSPSSNEGLLTVLPHLSLPALDKPRSDPQISGRAPDGLSGLTRQRHRLAFELRRVLLSIEHLRRASLPLSQVFTVSGQDQRVLARRESPSARCQPLPTAHRPLTNGVNSRPSPRGSRYSATGNLRVRSSCRPR